MKKVRLILACLITAACFSAFVISCKKSSSDSSSCKCTEYEIATGEATGTRSVSLKDASDHYGMDITSCSQLGGILTQYDGEGYFTYSCE